MKRTELFLRDHERLYPIYLTMETLSLEMDGLGRAGSRLPLHLVSSRLGTRPRNPLTGCLPTINIHSTSTEQGVLLRDTCTTCLEIVLLLELDLVLRLKSVAPSIARKCKHYYSLFHIEVNYCDSNNKIAILL